MRRSFATMLVLAAAASAPCRAEAVRAPADDVEAYDAAQLFSRLCVSTRGDRGRAAQILGGDDSAVEKLDEKMLLQLQGGKTGGVGWMIRMPLGEKLIFDFTAGGTCLVRAPRVSGPSLEERLDNLVDEIGASGQFKIRRLGDDTKTINKQKYHFVSYSVRLPDTGETVELGVATTDAKDAFIQGTLTFQLGAGKS